MNNKDKAKKARKGRRECNKSSKVQWGIDNDKDDRTADNDTSSVEDDTRYAINSECQSVHAGQADNEDSDNELFRPCKRTSVIRKEIGRMNNDTFDICSKTGVRKNMPGNRHKNGRKTRKEESETETDSAGSSPRRPASSITSVTSRSSRSTSIYGKDSDDATSSYSA